MAEQEMSIARYAVLNSGNKFPLVGFGTYKITGSSTIHRAVDVALSTGYRSFDTAECYHNEKDLGKALKELLPKYNLKRSDISITSKLFTTDQGANKARAAALKSIANIDCEYLDLYLIHWPGAGQVVASSPENKRLRAESWKDLVKLNKEGHLKNIGVSNYTIRHLKELLENCDGVPPAVNQVEMHPRYQQRELLQFCQKENILLQAYSSLGGSGVKSLLKDNVVNAIAKEISKTPAQVLLRWALQKGVAIIPKSVTAERIQENADLEFELSEKQMSQLDGISVVEKYSWDPETVA